MLLDDSGKSEALNEYFTIVFTTDNGTLPRFPMRVTSNVNLSDVRFSLTAIFKHLKNLKSKHTRDPNGFTTSFLKKLDYVLIKPLCILFSFIFNNGSIPDDWRTANVMPIFKKGLSSCLSNYRPISLTSIFCKLFEQVIKECMLSYLCTHKLITRSQHGFLSMRSTSSQLLETIK